MYEINYVKKQKKTIFLLLDILLQVLILVLCFYLFIIWGGKYVANCLCLKQNTLFK